MTTHISYTTAKALKAFLGENAPEPVCERWYKPKTTGMCAWNYDGKNYPAYQLHDILSRPFCEAVAKKIEGSKWGGIDLGTCAMHIYADLGLAHYYSGLPAVEAELMKMMGGK